MNGTEEAPATSALCVFCGSAHGRTHHPAGTARRLGQACAQAGVTIVTGGGSVGLMGVVADAALAAGGRVIGVIPAFLERAEIAHPGLSEMIVTRDMHARKKRMFDLAHAFVALPGGIGTLDEVVEMLSWRYLGRHDKPVMLLDSVYWRPLTGLFDHMAAQGFLRIPAQPLHEVWDEPEQVARRAVESRIAP